MTFKDISSANIGDRGIKVMEKSKVGGWIRQERCGGKISHSAKKEVALRFRSLKFEPKFTTKLHHYHH